MRPSAPVPSATVARPPAKEPTAVRYVGHGCLRGQDHATEVGREHRVDLPERDFLDRAVPDGPGHADEDVRAAEFCGGAINRPLDRGGIDRVNLNRDRASRSRFDLGGGSVFSVGGAFIAESDVRISRREATRGGSADPTAAASNEGALSFGTFHSADSCC